MTETEFCQHTKTVKPFFENYFLYLQCTFLTQYLDNLQQYYHYYAAIKN